jgi:hypothetical protein
VRAKSAARMAQGPVRCHDNREHFARSCNPNQQRRSAMNRKSIGGVMLLGLLLVVGCNPNVGIIAVNANPQGATVYLNRAPTGETPTKFEFDMEKPVTMKLLKEGYKPVEDSSR